MTTLFRAVLFLFVFSESVLAQSSDESDYLCHSLIPLLPVMTHPAMQEPFKTEQDLINDFTKRTFELAQQGVVDAQYSIGVLLNLGYCLPKDVPRALYWHKEAAENGSAAAQHLLGASYLFGKEFRDSTPYSLDVPQDSEIALRWLNMAAEQGFRNTQWLLAQIYSSGTAKGVPKDLMRSYIWYAILGAKTELEKLTQKMSADQVEAAKSITKDWIQKHPQTVQ